MTLCNAFHISPFQIRRERFSEFCLLLKRFKESAKYKSNTTTPIPKGNKKNQIPVTD